jgi:hypothetical protein
MRKRASRDRVIAIMRRLGREPGARGRIYFTGGASAVLDGWRETTVDIDVEIEGDAERLLRSLVAIKDELHVSASRGARARSGVARLLSVPACDPEARTVRLSPDRDDRRHVRFPAWARSRATACGRRLPLRPSA